MNRIVRLGSAVVALGMAVAAQAAWSSKTYVFKSGTKLEVGADLGDGLTLKSVEFLLPDDDRAGAPVKADVAIANGSDAPEKIGIAIALFAEDGALVGVASGSSKFLAIKPGRISFYVLEFQNVSERIGDAARFQITVESK